MIKFISVLLTTSIASNIAWAQTEIIDTEDIVAPNPVFEEIDVSDDVIESTVTVFEAGELGDKNRKYVASQERLEARGRCLTVLGVPGDITLSKNQIDELELELEANNIELPDENTVILKGDAFARQGPQQISGQELRYSKNDNTVRGEGDVEVYSINGDKFSTGKLELELDTFIGEASETEYQIAEREFVPRLKNNAFVRARGKGSNVQFLGHDLLKFSNASYTICPEGNEDVVVYARELELDFSENAGTVWHGRVEFFGLPIFYLPWFTFPITDERKTGLLAPVFGTDEDSGFFVAAPIYWNIHPQADLTFTPWYYSDRGVQLSGEFRYLTEKSEGKIEGAYLPSDDLFGDDRGFINVQHETEFTENLDGDIDYSEVSDTDYYDDFGENLYVRSSSFITQKGTLRYFNNGFSATTNVTKYDAIDSTISDSSLPYERLPAVDLKYEKRRGLLNLTYGAEGSFTHFNHSDRVDGQRFTIEPYAELPIEEVYGSITPRVAFRYNAYTLSDVTVDEETGLTNNEDPDFYTTITSVDSKLFLEREFDWAGDEHIQTLEPRLFYVYIPDSNQSGAPTFDTSALNLNNFSNIYRENRFFGDDRVGDTNQITVGLTSRILNGTSNREQASFSIGQVYFFEDREISIDSDDADITDSESDLLGQANIKLYNDWEFKTFLAWDTDESESRVRRFSLSYDRDDAYTYDGLSQSGLGSTYLDVSYFFTRPENGSENEQITAEGGWKFNNAWSIYGRTIYDIDDSDVRYWSTGLKYSACCWSLALTGEKRIVQDGDSKENVFLTFELSGLTKVQSGL